MDICNNLLLYTPRSKSEMVYTALLKKKKKAKKGFIPPNIWVLFYQQYQKAQMAEEQKLYINFN